MEKYYGKQRNLQCEKKRKLDEPVFDPMTSDVIWSQSQTNI